MDIVARVCINERLADVRAFEKIPAEVLAGPEEGDLIGRGALYFNKVSELVIMRAVLFFGGRNGFVVAIGTNSIRDSAQ